MLTRRRVLGLVAAIAAASGLWLAAQKSGSRGNSVKLLNVSYDVSRELWIDLNEAFLADRK